MKYLLDTHIFIWWTHSPEKVPNQYLSLLLDKRNDIYLSHASIWEMQIKVQLGKLRLGMPLQKIVASQTQINNLLLLQILQDHIYSLDVFSNHHSDPFDKMLVSQCMVEKMRLITSDSALRRYITRLDANLLI